MRISDWSSDVCSSDLGATTGTPPSNPESPIPNPGLMRYDAEPAYVLHARAWRETSLLLELLTEHHGRIGLVARGVQGPKKHVLRAALQPRSEEHTSELQSLMRISYAVFCLKKKKKRQ